MSAADVRLLSKSLVYSAQMGLYKADRHLLDAKMLDWLCWGLEWYKWIGDQAISVIISKLSYNYAPFVEAVVMPAKDLLVEHMGIWLSDYVTGASSPSAYIDCEKLEQTGLAMLENTLTNLSEDAKSPKKVGGILAVYLVVKTANHYFYDKNEDGSSVGIYGAITSAFGDLTVQGFKIMIGKSWSSLPVTRQLQRCLAAMPTSLSRTNSRQNSLTREENGILIYSKSIWRKSQFLLLPSWFQQSERVQSV